MRIDPILTGRRNFLRLLGLTAVFPYTSLSGCDEEAVTGVDPVKAEAVDLPPEPWRPAALRPPEGFRWTPPLQFDRSGALLSRLERIWEGETITDYYVDPMTASPGDGRQAGRPGKWLSSVLEAASGAGTPWVRINLAEGVYDYRHLPADYPCKHRHVIIKAQGKVRIGPLAIIVPGAWQPDEAGAFYQFLADEPIEVRDEHNPDGFGGAASFAKAGSLTACRALPGSWFWDNRVLTVNPLGGKRPDAGLLVLFARDNLVFKGGLSLILDGDEEGIELLGGENGCLITRENQAGSLLVMRNVWLRYSRGKNLDVFGVSRVFMLGGGSTDARTDNLSYHRSPEVVPMVMEIGVSSLRAGANQAGNNNASTAHDGCCVVRMAGLYQWADGPVVADVGDGTQSWNVGCRSGGSWRDPGPVRAAWLVSTGTASIWLDECSQTPGVDYDITVSGGAVAYVRQTATQRAHGDVRTY